MTRAPRCPVFGAVPGADGVRFRLWAPTASRADLHLRRASGDCSTIPLQRSADASVDGVWAAVIAEATAGDRYAYSVDGGEPRPDPAARFLPDGVHGWAEIVNPRAFKWDDASWRGIDPRAAIIYELHIGTFTPAGTFRAAIEKLPYLRNLGVTAIEIMPVADFAGARNWGYDGVALFAPSRAYGRPDDLRALIDAAHRADIAVILDVVYNHFGPEGAYLAALSPVFLTDKHKTPWGGAVNLDDEWSEGVRAFLTDNALHWIAEYHVDGLRLDATHSLFDARERHFVAELTEAVHRAAEPSPVVYAEDHRNLASMIEVADTSGWGLDGVWADDFHHVVRTMLAGDRHGYYIDFKGTACELAETLRKGWLYTGQPSEHEQAPRGTDPSHVAMRKAVICVQNHDQVGNRALGDRLHHAIDAASWRAAVTVLLTAPMTPLLFMGQEWATSAPFQFFTDFEPELGKKVVEGRRNEFKAFPQFATEEGARTVPDPQAESTFETSKLRWDELHQPEHARVLALHRALLALRNTHWQLQASDAPTCHADAIDADTVVFFRDCNRAGPRITIVVRLRGSGRVTVDGVKDAGTILLNTEDEAFAVDPSPIQIDPAAGTIEFTRPGALLFLGRSA